MEPTQRVLEPVRRLLTEQRLGVLATWQPEGPHTSLVAFAATRDLRQLFILTARSTRKYRHLAEAPDVALLVDDRGNTPADFNRAKAVTAYGRLVEVPADQRADALTRYLECHPHLAGFAGAPDVALLRLEVTRYSLVQRFQEVLEIVVGR